MANLCIIPARGGSKRIPRKNIRDFLGKPIIAYSIETAIGSNLFDEVMVSTEDDEISRVAKKYGASVPFVRSKKNADDYATTVDVLKEVVEGYKELGKFFDRICCIYPCSPLVNIELLRSGYTKLLEDENDSIVPIVPFSFPIQRSFVVQGDKISYSQAEYQKARSQDLERHYHDAGMFYWFNTYVLDDSTLITSNTGYLELNETQAQDIDNETDWHLAELKYKLLYS